MPIAKWLSSLGLGQYEQVFREHAIDFETLTELTEGDLEKLGLPLGHRKKILKAAASLTNTGDESSSAARIATARLRADSAERRQLSVAFCDLVGSTALVSRLDPEDMREVIGAYHRCVAETVRRFDGYVGRYMDDGALIYFGYPTAHEDDAERAIHAGLELAARIRALRPMEDVELHSRVGIATGLVVVGDLLALAEVQERYAVGETLNRAARLQSAAEPDTVIIDQATRQLVGNLFDVHDLGPTRLKDIPEPIRTWRVLKPSDIESRFEAFHSTQLSPLIGRDEEIELILGRWRNAKRGRGQTLLIQGEPGIGKSRIVAELLERIESDPHANLRYFCSPHHTNSALYPIISQCEHAARFERNDTLESKLDKLDTLLSRSSTLDEDRAVFAELLSLPAADERRPLIFNPQQRKQKTFEALIRQTENLACQQPLLLIFEDAHWADPTSLELLDRTIERIPQLPVLLIITLRPDFLPSWIGQPHVTSLTLSRLDSGEAAMLIDRIAGGEALPDGARTEIVQRASGMPLFIEELTKAVLEGAVTSVALSIPAALHASLIARLDRLGPAKEAAQIGATLGREFTYELLAAVARRDEGELQDSLTRLNQAGLVFCRGAPPNASFVFKHALIQEAAYGMLLRGRRQELHARVAQALEELFPESCDTQPELLAHHCAEAGLNEKAAVYFGRAGQKSISRSALTEAVAQFRMGLDQIAKLPKTPAVQQEQLRLQVALAGTLVHIEGYAAPAVIEAYEIAHSLVEQAYAAGEPPRDPLLRFSIMYGLWVSHYVAIDTEIMRKRAEQFLAMAGQQTLPAPRLIGHRLMGTTLVMRGEFQAAREHLDQAVALYVHDEHRALATRFSQDIGVSALAYRSWALWHLGYPDAALRDADHLLRWAREPNQVPTLAYGLFHVIITQLLCGQLAAAERCIDELSALAQKHGMVFWKHLGLFLHGWLLTVAGRGVEAVPILHEAVTSYSSTRSTNFRPLFHGVLANALAQQGEFKPATVHITDALSAMRRTNERWSEAELHRIAAELQLLNQNFDDAIPHFHASLDVARGQLAKSYELRTATSLARLLIKQGQGKEARGLLAPIYGWFTEGFETRDLQEARALLEATAP